MASHKSSNSALSAHGVLFWFLRAFHLPSQCDTSPSLLTAALERACLHSIPPMLCQNLFESFSWIHSQTLSTIVHSHTGSHTTGRLILVRVCWFRCIFSSLTSFNARVHNQDLCSCCSLNQHSDLLTKIYPVYPHYTFGFPNICPAASRIKWSPSTPGWLQLTSWVQDT